MHYLVFPLPTNYFLAKLSRNGWLRLDLVPDFTIFVSSGRLEQRQ